MSASVTPLQAARDQAIVAECLTEAILASGLGHLTGEPPVPAPTVLHDLTALRRTVQAAKDEAHAARLRAQALSAVTEALMRRP